MKQLNVEQNTDAWLELRRTKIGASDAPSIMGVGYKKPSQLMEEKLTGKECYTTAAMQRGKELEPVARELISQKHGANYQPIVAQNAFIDWQIASLDGFDEKSGRFIEIKCPSQEKYAKIARGEVPIEYFWQIQHQLCVMDQREACLVAFDGKNLVETIIKKDEKAIVDLIDKENEFHRMMTNFEMPKDPIDELTSKESHTALKEFLEVDGVFEQIKELREIKREAVLYHCNDRTSRINGVTIRRIMTKGKVDYSKVPELTGLNLEPYRSESYVSWRIEKPKVAQEN